jgi:hypothetical protein
MSLSNERLPTADKYTLQPTRAQERVLEETWWRRRVRSNTALEQRSFLWKPRGVSSTRYEQAAELKDLRAEMPADAAVQRHALQDVPCASGEDLSSVLPAGDGG